MPSIWSRICPITMWEAGPRSSPLCLCLTRYLSIGNGLQKASSWTRDRSRSHCQWPHTLPKPPLSPAFRRPTSVLCRVPSCQPGVDELQLPQASCFCGFPIMVLSPLLILSLLPLFRLDLRSSAQWLVVDLRICFLQLLGEGSMMTIMVVLNLITREGPVQAPFALLLRVLSGVILVHSWEFP